MKAHPRTDELLVNGMRFPGGITLASCLPLSCLTVSCLALSCLALGACAPTPTPTVSGDGDYRGSATRFQVGRRNCPRPGLLTISVRSATMFYRWDNQYIPASVLSNGTVSGVLPGVQLTGTHDGTTIRGNVTDGQCGLHFTLRRVGS